MTTELDILCKPCRTPYELIAESAPHDENLIDVVVSCRHCGHTLNAFISIDEMTEVPQEHHDE